MIENTIESLRKGVLSENLIFEVIGLLKMFADEYPSISNSDQWESLIYEIVSLVEKDPEIFNCKEFIEAVVTAIETYTSQPIAKVSSLTYERLLFIIYAFILNDDNLLMFLKAISDESLFILFERASNHLMSDCDIFSQEIAYDILGRIYFKLKSKKDTRVNRINSRKLSSVILNNLKNDKKNLATLKSSKVFLNQINQSNQNIQTFPITQVVIANESNKLVQDANWIDFCGEFVYVEYVSTENHSRYKLGYNDISDASVSNKVVWNFTVINQLDISGKWSIAFANIKDITSAVSFCYCKLEEIERRKKLYSAVSTRSISPVAMKRELQIEDTQIESTELVEETNEIPSQSSDIVVSHKQFKSQIIFTKSPNTVVQPPSRFASPLQSNISRVNQMMKPSDAKRPKYSPPQKVMIPMDYSSKSMHNKSMSEEIDQWETSSPDIEEYLPPVTNGKKRKQITNERPPLDDERCLQKLVDEMRKINENRFQRQFQTKVDKVVDIANSQVAEFLSNWSDDAIDLVMEDMGDMALQAQQSVTSVLNLLSLLTEECKREDEFQNSIQLEHNNELEEIKNTTESIITALKTELQKLLDGSRKKIVQLKSEQVTATNKQISKILNNSGQSNKFN